MYYCIILIIFFFFQAEDGIRDYKVTGVQTCALPISCGQQKRRLRNSSSWMEGANSSVRSKCPVTLECHHEIGRASCRERVTVKVDSGFIQIIRKGSICKN